MEENNWDLQAVVRSCCFSEPTNASVSDHLCQTPLPAIKEVKEEKITEPGSSDGFLFQKLTDGGGDRTAQELDNLYISFLPKSVQEKNEKISPVLPVPLLVVPQSNLLNPVPNRIGFGRMPNRPQASRSKRRKNQQKKTVIQVPVDRAASADLWAWRKYGQKPIKGSPYPRGYYKCSSSKGCLARKQVERSRTDPSMLVITYTAEHNHPAPTHRNSLAGTTRHVSTHPLGQSSPDQKEDETKHETELEGELEEGEDEEESEEGMIKVEDMELLGEDDLLFMGLEETNSGNNKNNLNEIKGLFDESELLEERRWMINGESALRSH
ncbi:hypothetical protein LUZ60_010057 [Juncus effusus]|nr:hypothetical protein LUZ60_010057 [Juncus effusus]